MSFFSHIGENPADSDPSQCLPHYLPWRSIGGFRIENMGWGEFARADGSIILGELICTDMIITPDGDIPVFVVLRQDGEYESVFDFDKWRPAASPNPPKSLNPNPDLTFVPGKRIF